jgi:hypothetical protein
MTDKQLYDYAYNFLLTFDTITKEDLEFHLRAEHEKPRDLSIIFKELCKSAQNKQMSSKVIGKSIGGIENLSKVLDDFNPKKVAQKYKKTEGGKLLTDIILLLKPTGQVRTTTRSLWPQFCQSVVEAAHFLDSFETAENFYDWANLFAKDNKSKPALPLMISIEISGIGFPLACDFLKELGFIDYGKPDVHLKDIFKALDIINPDEKSVLKQDYETLKAIDRIAKENSKTPYAVDKVFWLIGSGDFYLTKKNIGRQKQKFITEIKSLNT